MFLCRPVLPPLLSLLALFSLASSGHALRSDVLYTTRGEFVQVSPMRPLTLNAHLTQFAYEPLGLEVAAVGSETSGDQTVHFVKTIDVRTGHEFHRLTITTPSDGAAAGFLLLGWTPSGKYLLLERTQSDEGNPNETVTDLVRWDLSADPPVVRPVTPEVTLPPGAAPYDLSTAASPHRRWILFSRGYAVPDANGKMGPAQRAYTLYDPERNTSRPLTLPKDASLGYETWFLDDTHLHIHVGETGIAADKWLDVVTGQITAPNVSALSSVTDTSKQYPDLTLNVEHRLQEDINVKGSGGRLDSCLLWIRRTPLGKQPLGAAAAGLTPGEDDPQAVWSPTGRQIAFLSHGDLCVTDLMPPTGLLPHEKMAVGLALACAEERQLAASNLKQIGLALIQYSQDFDEHYPPTKGLNDAIYPYLKTRDVFQVGSHSFVYRLPGGTSLAEIDSPAETVQGEMDLPCARIVLFADGHVKSFPKPNVLPGGAH